MRGDEYKKILKLVSVVVVLNLAFGGFLGLMLVEEKGTVEAGDIPMPDPWNIVVDGLPELRLDGSRWENNTWDVDANITVTNGGILTIMNTNVVFQIDTDHRYFLKVELNGALNLINSTITVQTDDLFDNYEEVYWFNSTDYRARFKRMIPFNVDITGAGSELNMDRDSGLKYEGELYIRNGANATIRDSVISSPNAPYSDYDWGVVVHIENANPVVIEDSRVEKSPWFQGVSYCDLDQWQNDFSNVTMYNEHTITNSEVHIINTYFDIDYQNRTTPALHTDWDNDYQDHYPYRVNPNHNSLVITDSTVKFYGLTIDMSETGNKIPDKGYTAIEVMDTVSDVTLYRWLAVSPVDNKSVPVEGAVVNITTDKTDAFAAIINDLNRNVNNQYAWDYLNRISDGTIMQVGDMIQGTTGKSGRVIFALASDMLTETGWPNSDQCDGYDVEATYDDPVAVPPIFVKQTGHVDFENFPRVFPQDNFVNYILDPFDFAAPHPELTIDFDPTPPTSELEGVIVNIKVKIWNLIVTGSGVNVDNVKVQFWDGNPSLNTSTKIGEVTIPSILAGTNQTVSINWSASPSGAHRIYVGVDRDFENPFLDNLIPEINENDNVIDTSITVLERPDLFIDASDIQFIVSGEVVDVVVNGTAVQIRAFIHNIGGTIATNVEVSFYDGTFSGPGDYIGSTNVTVGPGEKVTASKGWGPSTGFHYIWVYVDESDVILEKNENNNNATNTLEVKSRPNLIPSIVIDPPSPVYQGTPITITAVVANDGGWNVTQPVKVEFYHTDPYNPDYRIGEDTIPIDPPTQVSILAGGSEEASIPWTVQSPGTYYFYVRVDPDDDVDESVENDNLVQSAPYVVNPRPNLVIRSEDIVLSNAYPMNNTGININITIRNTGLSDVTDTFHIRIWLGEFGDSGNYLTEMTVTEGVTSGGFVYRDFDWTSATPPGKHKLWVYLDYYGTIDETSDKDNYNYTTIIIYEIPPDLIVNDTTFYPAFSPYPGLVILEDAMPPDHSPFTIKGFTLVEESGVLIIRNTQFQVIGQSYDDEFNIVVKDQGILIIDDNSFLTTENLHVNIYLFDDATLYINSSTIDSRVDIIAADSSKIYIDDHSLIRGEIFAREPNSNVYINAVNSTFTHQLQYIGSNTFVELWGVYIAGAPASNNVISVAENAKVYINWFLTIDVVDVNHVAIENAVVAYYRSPPWKESDSRYTSSEGKAYFWLRGMNITSTSVVESIGNYKIKANFTSPYTLITYYPDVPPDPYTNTTVWMLDNIQRTIKFSSVKPDLDPPLGVDPQDTYFAVGSPALVMAYVNNTGPGNATDVWVKFDDDTNEAGWPKWYHKDFIEPGGSWYIEFEWIPQVIGNHNISIHVDPNDLIIEGDPNNNDNVVLVYVTPMKADLVVTSIMYAKDQLNPYGPTENDTITITAHISNIGETDAFPDPELAVEYYLDSIAPQNFLGWGNISGVARKQTATSLYKWSSTTPPGWHTIWVVVDPPSLDLVEEANESNNTASIDIYLKKYADITPIGLEFLVDGSPESSVTDSTWVTIKAIVQNLGETNATNVQVQFFDGDPDSAEGATQIGSKKISHIGAKGNTGEAEVVWIATVVGKLQIHQIFVKVGGVAENFLHNNNYSRTITVTLRPDLSVVDIWFDDESPYQGQAIKIFASVLNSGGTNTTVFYVGFWDGDPDLGGTQIGTYQPLSVNIDEIGTVSVPWIDTEKGAHEIFAVADAWDNKINEVYETNNKGSEVIVVYSDRDLIVNNSNTPKSIGSEATPDYIYRHRGYTLVEENGVLTIKYTTFQVLETVDYEYNIIVRNNGTLIIKSDSMVLTNGPLLKIYLYDDARLYINDTIIDSTVIEILAFGRANIFITESTINSHLKATASTADIRLYATNASLTQPFIYFRGTSEAVFTNVTTPEVKLSDSTKLTVYKWLKAYVKDGAGTGIEGSNVTVKHYPDGPQIPNSPKHSGFEGLALFYVMTDIMYPGDNESFLSYDVSAVFNYQGYDYTGGPELVYFTSYVDDKTDNVEVVEIYLLELLPDFHVENEDITFWKGSFNRTGVGVGVGEEITIQAVVHNMGNAVTTAETQVLVEFYIKMDVDLIVLGQDIIDTGIPANGGTGTASITWIPKEDEVGDKEIWVHVDPNNEVPEETDIDNRAFNFVTVVIPPDLTVTSIRFNTVDFQDVSSVIESEIVTIEAEIRNVGERGTSDINVSIFSGFPDFDGDMRPDSPLPTGVDLIGFQNLGPLNPGLTTTVSIPWDTSGVQRAHLIYVYAVDSRPPGYIADQILSNNNKFESFQVHPKPDLRPEILPPHTTYITAMSTGGTEITGDLLINQVVVLQAAIWNYGQSYIHAVNVSFYEGDPNSGGQQIGSDVTIQISPNTYMNASVEWYVTGQERDQDIYVWVNKDEEVMESDYANNIESSTFTVSLADITVEFTQAVKSEYKTGATIQVIAKVTFTDTGEGVQDLDYTIRIRRRSNNQQVGSAITGSTDENGDINREISAPGAGGEYYVEIAVDYPNVPAERSGYFEAQEEAKLPLPWWMILLIIVIGVLAVLLVGILLGKYGLGRLVECGECGAFIPEGEKKCPKCGAVFEADTAKCSECGAWIPVTSKSCPECGAVFAGLEKEKKGYIESMKLQYAEYVEQYRDEAKEELGEAMTDEMFMGWWKRSPKYVGFEEWLAREEELKKGRIKNCPECNTVNPESAAICFKCGSVFKEEEEEEILPEEEMPPEVPPVEVPPKVVPKTVERPPEAPGAPPTVVPKKVARPPEVVPKKVVKAPPTVVPKKVVKPPEGRPPTVVPKKVVKRPPPEEEE